jgi:hypothetical protein
VSTIVGQPRPVGAETASGMWGLEHTSSRKQSMSALPANSGRPDKHAIDPERKWAPGSHAPRRTTSSIRTRSVEPRVPPTWSAPPSPRGPVRRPQIWELSEKIAVGSYAVRRHLSICEDGEEVIENVVRERPAIVRI